MERSRPSSRFWLMAVVVLGLTLAACSGNDSDDELGVPGETTSSSSTTTTASTTTSNSTIEPTSTTIDDEAAVRELHTYFMTDVTAVDDTREVALEEELAPYLEVLVDPFLTRIIEGFTQERDRSQWASSPGYESNIVSVTVDGSVARVVDCSRGRGVLYDEDGAIVIPADDYFKFRESELVKVDGRWWIRDLFVGGDERCDPDDF